MRVSEALFDSCFGLCAPNIREVKTFQVCVYKMPTEYILDVGTTPSLLLQTVRRSDCIQLQRCDLLCSNANPDSVKNETYID